MSDLASEAEYEQVKERERERMQVRTGAVSIFLTAVLEFLENPSFETRLSAVRKSRNAGWKWHEMQKILTGLKQRNVRVWVEFITVFKGHPMFQHLKNISPFNNVHLASVRVDESGGVEFDLTVLEEAIMTHVHNLQKIHQNPKGEYLVTLRISKRRGIGVFRLKNKK